MSVDNINNENLFLPDVQYFIFRRCTPEWRIKPHTVDRYDITYIIKGKARYTINGVRHELSAGDLLCLPEGSKKEAITYRNHLMQCFSVNFEARNLKGESVVPAFPPVSHIDIHDDIIRLFHEFNYAYIEKRPGYLFKTSGLLMMILNRFLEFTVYKDQFMVDDFRIKETVRYIVRHYAERLLVKDLAVRAGISTPYFGNLFKRETGMTIHQFVAKVRVTHAENLLQSGGYHVSEVAELCGYCDMFHFYKQFKAITGASPSHHIPRHGS
jgi:AraC-like DNA-binding protein